MESLFELWGKRNPEWEKRYQTSIMDVFTDYGKGVNQYQDVRGKIFGAGYEIFIIAFFIGLYYNQTKPLIEDKSKRKVLGQAIMYWGNVENRLGRNSYGKIREYMFAALIARTDVDLIALDKGEITARSVVDCMITKMEQYANFGFDYIQEKLENDPNYFYKESAFLRVFLSFLSTDVDSNDNDDEPDPLDLPDDDHAEVDALDEEAMRKEAEKPWAIDDIEYLTFFYKKNMEISRIAERLKKSIYSVKYQLSLLGLLEMPINVNVSNTALGSSVVNNSGEVVYSDYAPLKIIKNKIYRFNRKSMCLTVKEIKRAHGEWLKGTKLLVAYSESDLFHAISSPSFIDDIEDFEVSEIIEQNKIKVKGSWYDYYGDIIKD